MSLLHSSLTHLDCLEMLVEVVSVVLRAPNDSTSEESRDLSLLVLQVGQTEEKKPKIIKNEQHRS